MFTTDQLALSLKSKIYPRKDIFPNYIEFAKHQKKIGSFSWSHKSYNWKVYF